MFFTGILLPFLLTRANALPANTSIVAEADAAAAAFNYALLWGFWPWEPG